MNAEVNDLLALRHFPESIQTEARRIAETDLHEFLEDYVKEKVEKITNRVLNNLVSITFVTRTAYLYYTFVHDPWVIKAGKSGVALLNEMLAKLSSISSELDECKNELEATTILRNIRRLIACQEYQTDIFNWFPQNASHFNENMANCLNSQYAECSREAIVTVSLATRLFHFAMRDKIESVLLAMIQCMIDFTAWQNSYLLKFNRARERYLDHKLSVSETTDFQFPQLNGTLSHTNRTLLGLLHYAIVDLLYQIPIPALILKYIQSIKDRGEMLRIYQCLQARAITMCLRQFEEHAKERQCELDRLGLDIRAHDPQEWQGFVSSVFDAIAERAIERNKLIHGMALDIITTMSIQMPQDLPLVDDEFIKNLESIPVFPINNRTQAKKSKTSQNSLRKGNLTLQQTSDLGKLSSTDPFLNQEEDRDDWIFKETYEDLYCID